MRMKILLTLIKILSENCIYYQQFWAIIRVILKNRIFFFNFSCPLFPAKTFCVFEKSGQLWEKISGFWGKKWYLQPLGGPMPC